MSKKNDEEFLKDSLNIFEDRISNKKITPKNKNNISNIELKLENKTSNDNKTSFITNNFNKTSNNTSQINFSNADILNGLNMKSFKTEASNEADQQKLFETFILFQKFVSMQNNQNLIQKEETIQIISDNLINCKNKSEENNNEINNEFKRSNNNFNTKEKIEEKIDQVNSENLKNDNYLNDNLREIKDIDNKKNITNNLSNSKINNYDKIKNEIDNNLLDNTKDDNSVGGFNKLKNRRKSASNDLDLEKLTKTENKIDILQIKDVKFNNLESKLDDDNNLKINNINNQVCKKIDKNVIISDNIFEKSKEKLYKKGNTEKLNDNLKNINNKNVDNIKIDEIEDIKKLTSNNDSAVIDKNKNNSKKKITNFDDIPIKSSFNKVENFDEKPIKSSNINFIELFEKNLAEQDDKNLDLNHSEIKVNIKKTQRIKKEINITKPTEVKKYKYYADNFDDKSIPHVSTIKDINEDKLNSIKVDKENKLSLNKTEKENKMNHNKSVEKINRKENTIKNQQEFLLNNSTNISPSPINGNLINIKNKNFINNKKVTKSNNPTR